MTATVRDAMFDVMRRYDMTTVFGNPGSTEIPLLADFPDDLRFVLGLHEAAVVGVASGYAIARGTPSLVNLHTAAGLGNAVNAIACARDNRVPLVVTVGQQDRRQLALAPFLTGRDLERLAGDYPVWTTTPAVPADVPGAVVRAWHEARVRRGPALVVVPMGDWEEPCDGVRAAPDALRHDPIAAEAPLAELQALLDGAERPALVVGAGLDTEEGWRGVVALAERLGCPVWQDTFSSRAAFPQDHPQFAGHLPWRRRELRVLFAEHDVVVALGTPAFRLYLYDDGPIVPATCRVAVVTDDLEEAARSNAELAVVASPAEVCARLAGAVAGRSPSCTPLARSAPPDPGGPLTADQVLFALGERLPVDAILVEEAPSHRPELLDRIAIRRPGGFLAVANGALGFGLASAIGLRLASQDRPVVAVLGDGSSTYTVQALWTAATYGAGVVFVVLSNGRYAVMDKLAADHSGGAGAWPAFPTLELATVAAGFGCPARVVRTHDELLEALDDAIPGAVARSTPLLLDVRVS
ncbi:MAG TPA: thiamine pyrophosphate-dependent enzyme [Gaiellaceae bacterium]|nr:thiamine pyrophosphate-dependent enzyme [Gaiellaceae bacterium]